MLDSTLYPVDHHAREGEVGVVVSALDIARFQQLLDALSLRVDDSSVALLGWLSALTGAHAAPAGQVTSSAVTRVPLAMRFCTCASSSAARS